MNFVQWFLDYLYGLRKYNYYMGTLMGKYLYHELYGSEWWNSIDDVVVLGGIPLHNLGHLQAFKQQHIGAIVSALEDFETQKTFYFHPVSRDEWIAQGIEYLHVPTEDTRGLQLSDLIEAVEFLYDHARRKIKIYVHCKAGKGRSASIVLGYLLLKKFETLGSVGTDDIVNCYQCLKQLRESIEINEIQMEPINQYVDWLNRDRGRVKLEN
jgi:atypical dual specificity phosphatase|uniref:Uncharacterized protein n=1 Tax=viral metagenome TaxID=1070528 RepID=A0A6C0BM61_9ZZZZ